MGSRSKRFLLVLVLVGVLLLPTAQTGPHARANDLVDQVHAFILDNGLRVLMVVRDHAPVIHFNLMFDVGGVDEPPGLGGIAHMVEHMAFKGTGSVGSLDPEEEARRLAEVEQAADALDAARQAAGDDPDQDPQVAEAEAVFAAARERAQEVAVPDVLNRIFDPHGAVGYNATTGYDRTSYVISLPSNRLELWARLQADVLRDAVFRFFYEEVDVVKEERRQRNEDDPTGYLLEHFTATAYEVHPYGRPLIGSMEEISAYRTEVAREFWDAHYHPNRAVLVMVGDLQPERDLQIIERYFGEIPAGPEVRRPEIPAEPPQQEERRVTVTYDAEPEIVVGYHRPTYPERDAYVMDVVSSLLGSGRTSRLYRRMVTDDRLALGVSTYAAYPGVRYGNMLLFHGHPRHPHGPEDLEQALYDEIERLQNELVDDWELQKVKNQTRAGFIRGLRSSGGLASQMAFYELFLDGWDQMLEYEAIISSITAEEIRDAARRYLVPENRTVGILLSESAGGDTP